MINWSFVWNNWFDWFDWFLVRSFEVMNRFLILWIFSIFFTKMYSWAMHVQISQSFDGRKSRAACLDQISLEQGYKYHWNSLWTYACLSWETYTLSSVQVSWTSIRPDCCPSITSSPKFCHCFKRMKFIGFACLHTCTLVHLYTCTSTHLHRNWMFLWAWYMPD
jgi:hypothetical protein